MLGRIYITMGKRYLHCLGKPKLRGKAFPGPETVAYANVDAAIWYSGGNISRAALSSGKLSGADSIEWGIKCEIIFIVTCLQPRKQKKVRANAPGIIELKPLRESIAAVV